MKKINELHEQCNIIVDNLNSGCVECDEKAIDFYKSIIKYLEVLDTLLFCTELTIKDWCVESYYVNDVNVDEYEYKQIKECIDENC